MPKFNTTFLHVPISVACFDSRFRLSASCLTWGYSDPFKSAAISNGGFFPSPAATNLAERANHSNRSPASGCRRLPATNAPSGSLSGLLGYWQLNSLPASQRGVGGGRKTARRSSPGHCTPRHCVSPSALAPLFRLWTSGQCGTIHTPPLCYYFSPIRPTTWLPVCHPS